MIGPRDLEYARAWAAHVAALEDVTLTPEGQTIVLLAQALTEAEEIIKTIQAAADNEAKELCQQADQQGCYVEQFRALGQNHVCRHCTLYDRAVALIVPPAIASSGQR